MRKSITASVFLFFLFFGTANAAEVGVVCDGVADRTSQDWLVAEVERVWVNPVDAVYDFDLKGGEVGHVNPREYGHLRCVFETYSGGEDPVAASATTLQRMVGVELFRRGFAGQREVTVLRTGDRYKVTGETILPDPSCGRCARQ